MIRIVNTIIRMKIPIVIYSLGTRPSKKSLVTSLVVYSKIFLHYTYGPQTAHNFERQTSNQKRVHPPVHTLKPYRTGSRAEDVRNESIKRRSKDAYSTRCTERSEPDRSAKPLKYSQKSEVERHGERNTRPCVGAWNWVQTVSASLHLGAVRDRLARTHAVRPDGSVRRTTQRRGYRGESTVRSCPRRTESGKRGRW